MSVHTVSSGWAPQRGHIRVCNNTRCERIIPATRNYVTGPIECWYCSDCRPGPDCGCDVCRVEFPLAEIQDPENAF